MPSNFDNAASFYDRLSQLVFGSATMDAQIWVLQFIKPKSSVLIVGGGTGLILPQIAKVHHNGLYITYFELSAKMMELSVKRNCADNIVSFINAPVESIGTTAAFDVVITPFLFDNFTNQTAKAVFDSIHKNLKPGGIWLLADFNLTGKLWQAILLKAMYIFFKALCQIEANKMPEYEMYFKNSGYELLDTKSFYGQFIIARVLAKPGN